MNQTGFGALLPLLLVLTSGWLLLRSRYWQPLIWWQSGYNLYFRIAFAGILCLAFSFIVVVFARFCLADSLCGGGHTNFLSALLCQQETFTLSVWLTLPVGMLGWAVGNLLSKANSSRLKEKQEKIVQRKNFEGYLKKTMTEHNFLLITLKSRKVYVGVVRDSSLRFNELDEGEQKYLRVIIALSGYRKDADMQMQLTTDYLDEEFQKSIREANPSSASQDGDWWKVNLEAMIPVNEITSIQPFDPQVYEKFFVGREDENQSNPPQHDAPDSSS